jgi:hypothetical protein
MGHRYGYILASSYYKETAKRRALEAAEEISFKIATTDLT